MHQNRKLSWDCTALCYTFIKLNWELDLDYTNKYLLNHIILFILQISWTLTQKKVFKCVPHNFFLLCYWCDESSSCAHTHTTTPHQRPAHKTVWKDWSNNKLQMIGPLDFWLEQDFILAPVDRENYSQSNCVFGFFSKSV
jgi:hypothetical protein